VKIKIILIISFLLVGCSGPNPKSELESCPKVYFSQNHNTYITTDKNSLTLENVTFRAHINNYFTKELCDLDNNTLLVDLSLLFVVKPENIKEPYISMPIYIATINSQDEIKDIQYFLVEGELKKNEEKEFIETEINNKFSIKIPNKDSISGLKNKILIGYMLDNEKIEILN
tara:strand:+ start:839 stop:1354 length:516 start_codon:yes stop_codon:yes gene_type:complete